MMENTAFELLDAFRNIQKLKRIAIVECMVADISHAVGKDNILERGAIGKRAVADISEIF